MALRKLNSVQQFATGTGAGALTLGAATSGKYKTIQDGGLGEGDTAYVRIQHNDIPAEWEIVLVTLVGSTVTRTFDPLSDSSTGWLISFSAGTKTISGVLPAHNVATLGVDGKLPDEQLPLGTAETLSGLDAAVRFIAAGNGGGYYSFLTTAARLADTAAPLNSTAQDLQDGNEYRKTGMPSTWTLIGPSTPQRVLNVETAVAGEIEARSAVVQSRPTGVYASAITRVNAGGWVTDVIDPSIATNLARTFGTWTTNGPFMQVNAGGWVIDAYEAAAVAPLAEETDTAERVGAVLDDKVETEPLLVGKNLLFGWGESKAADILLMAAFDELYPQVVGAYAGGVSVVDAFYNHGGYTVEEIMADAPAMRAVLDTAFAGGAEGLSFVALVEQANDMINRVDPEQWEASILRAMKLIQREGLQRYVGTDPAKPAPVAPVFQIMDCTWGRYPWYLRDIPLRSVEMAKRHYHYGLAAPDYICAFADDLHWLAPSRNLMIGYLALAAVWWRGLGRKYAPTQVVEAWLQGDRFFLRCDMPKPPLVADTALVSTIADNGLEAFGPNGARAVLYDLDIVGGGRIITGLTKDDDDAPVYLEGGGILQGGITGTTPGKSGKVDGPRTMYRDSTSVTATISGSPVALRSPLLPFIRYF